MNEIACKVSRRELARLLAGGALGLAALRAVPAAAGAPYAYPAYAFGYMHACYQRAVAGSAVT
jgi:hypothetical protein